MLVKAQWAYRSRQLLRALLGRVSDSEMAEARSVLGPASYKVFAAMPRQYRRHGLAVYETVREHGCNDPVVLQAALLHDCGKYDPVSGKYVTVVHRVLVVVLENVPGGNRLARTLALRGRRKPGGWVFYPFYLSRNHPRLGAELAARSGTPADVVRLVAAHHRPSSNDIQLWALQAADDKS
jgi:putative nucleotidyltransferase with HDIG domain